MKFNLIKKNIFIVLLVNLVLLFFSFAAPSYCQTQGGVTITPPIPSQDFKDLLERVINFIFLISIPITAIMITLAGFYFVTAVGEVDKIQKAKKILLWTAIGFTIILCAKGLVEFLQSQLRVRGG